MYRVATIGFALFSSAAGAAPVYLHCQFDPALDEDHRPPVDVTLNESDGTVTWKFANSERVYSDKAAFLADSVAFASSRVCGVTCEVMGGFTINRTNLSLHQRKMILPHQPGTELTYHYVPVGSCAVVQPRRAF